MNDESELDTERSLLDRAQAIPGRTWILIVLGVVLLFLGLSGRLGVGNDVDITREDAVEIARPSIDFEPVNADARLVRQGVGHRAVWAVSFSIPGSDGRNDFERLTTVELDAKTGEIIRVSVDNPDDG